jgi:hypothetical protein
MNGRKTYARMEEEGTLVVLSVGGTDSNHGQGNLGSVGILIVHGNFKTSTFSLVVARNPFESRGGWNLGMVNRWSLGM